MLTLVAIMAAAVMLVAAGSAAEAAKQPAAGTPASQAGYLVKVNCGGPAADGLLADQAYTAGSWGHVGGTPSTADTVAGEANYPTGMKSCRSSVGTFEYRFDVPRGVYNVKLHFAEPSFNQPGDRRFNVSINGVPKLINYDVYTDAGDRDKAVRKVFNGSAVVGGQLVVRLGAISGTTGGALV